MVHVTFYINNSAKNVANKQLVTLYSAEAQLKAETSTDAPVIFVGFNEQLYKCNYMYVQEFGRYYFVSRVRMANQIMYLETSKSDVLTSFKSQLDDVVATILRQSDLYNVYLQDTEILVYANSLVQLKKFPLSFDDYFNSFILVTNGGS